MELAVNLLSGLVGALIAIAVPPICKFWNRPILKLTFVKNEPGCVVKTPVTGNGVAGEKVYLRLKVKNPGKTFAKNVSVCVTKIVHYELAPGKTEFLEEVFYPKLSWGDGTPARFNLASGGHVFVDLFHTSNLPDAPANFDFTYVPYHLGKTLNKGKFEVDVFVAAENADSISSTFHWSYDGTLDGLKIVPA